MRHNDDPENDWSNPDAPVTVSIPYTPTAAELANPESIVIWYIEFVRCLQKYTHLPGTESCWQ